MAGGTRRSSPCEARRLVGDPRRLGRGHIADRIIRWCLALVFLGAAGAALVGLSALVKELESTGFGPWFRYTTIAMEVIGSALIIDSRTAGIGAGLLALTSLEAMYIHLIVLGSGSVPPFFLLILSVSVVWNHRGSFRATGGGPRAS